MIESNHKTGEIIPLGEIGDRRDAFRHDLLPANLLLDEVGIYRFRGKTIAANMYDPKESSLQPQLRHSMPANFRAGSRETIVEKDLSIWVIALAALGHPSGAGHHALEARDMIQDLYFATPELLWTHPSALDPGCRLHPHQSQE